MTYHNIITEWHATNPAANTFAGTRRELLREAHVVANLTHPMGTAEFNPDRQARRCRLRAALHQRQRSRIQQRRRAKREYGEPDAASRLDHDRDPAVRSALAESHAAGRRASATTPFHPPTSSPSDGDPKTLGEIYAYGFRNAHRLSWDTDGTMFASDIGMNHIEEINIVRNGENYGWMRREGYWENGRWRGGLLSDLFALPQEVLSGREKDGCHLSRCDLRPRRGARDHRRVRVPRPNRCAARQVRVRRYPEWPPLRGRCRRAEESRRWHSADRGADRGNPALCARRERQSHGRVDARPRRSDDGREHFSRRSAHQPDRATASCC